MADQPGNQTPNTPEVSETDLRQETVADLRAEAKQAGVSGTSGLRKEELVQELVKARTAGNGESKADDLGDGAGQADHAEQGDESSDGAGPDGGRVRTGEQSSRSLQYSQEVTSPDDDPERPGRSLVTTHHAVIRRWAEERNGVPATVQGTEHGDHLGVLRLDFSGDSDKLREVSWDEWFGTFDARRLNFIYQEETSDGKQSNFFRLESPDREDG